jgi:hypothetical protein
MTIEILFIIISGVLVGYNLKPVVLVGLTAVIGALMAWSGIVLATENLELAAMIPMAVIVIGLWFLVPMWISRFVKVIKRSKPDASLWVRFKEKILDIKK